MEFKSEWIKVGADEDMIVFADETAKKLEKISSSQIRNIYGEIKRIQIGGYDKYRHSFLLLKPRVAYAYGREKKNKNELKYFKNFFEKSSYYVKDEKSFNNFCNLMEAILAYHKSYNNND